MASLKEVLFKCLEDLEFEEFKNFKWHLQLEGGLEGFKAIPNGRLENADRNKTVDLMVGKYCEDAIKVTRMILGKIDRNDLVKCLSKTISKPSGKSWKDYKCDVTKIFRSAQSTVGGLVLDSSRCFSSHPKVFFISD